MSLTLLGLWRESENSAFMCRFSTSFYDGMILLIRVSRRNMQFVWHPIPDTAPSPDTLAGLCVFISFPNYADAFYWISWSSPSWRFSCFNFYRSSRPSGFSAGPRASALYEFHRKPGRIANIPAPMELSVTVQPYLCHQGHIFWSKMPRIFPVMSFSCCNRTLHWWIFTVLTRRPWFD